VFSSLRNLVAIFSFIVLSPVGASGMDIAWNDATLGIDQSESKEYADRILRWGFKFSEFVVGYTADHKTMQFDGFSR